MATTRPPLKALDRSGSVFHLGTFSKLVAPGLPGSAGSPPSPHWSRGWSSPNPKADRRHSSSATIYEFARVRPVFGAHIERVQREYCKRRDHIIAAVARELPNAAVAVPEGGYRVWVTLPDHVDGDLLAARAHDAGVHLIAGSRFFARTKRRCSAEPYPPVHSYTTPGQIDDGVRRLGAVYRALAGQ